MLATAAIDVENNVRDSCVIIAIAKAHSNGSTSIIYSRKLENDLDGEGHPFRLANMNFKYIWDNEEITLKKLKFGSIVEYSQVRDVFLYRGNTKLSRQVRKIRTFMFSRERPFHSIDSRKLKLKLKWKSFSCFNTCYHIYSYGPVTECLLYTLFCLLSRTK